MMFKMDMRIAPLRVEDAVHAIYLVGAGDVIILRP